MPPMILHLPQPLHRTDKSLDFHLHCRSFSQQSTPTRFRTAAAPPSHQRYSSQITSYSLASLAPLEAILFDIDGTLCDSDPLHFHAFREMLQEVGFNGGVPITEDYFINNISGMHNENLCRTLFPNWNIDRARKFLDDKEAIFRRMAAEEMEAMPGLHVLCDWIESQGLKRAAVTNAPRANAVQLISSLGLSGFFETLVIGSECDRAKPFPDPYLTALSVMGVSHEHAFVFEDSVSGIKAGVAAGMPVVGLGLRNPQTLLETAGATFVISHFLDSKLWFELQNKQQSTISRMNHRAQETESISSLAALYSSSLFAHCSLLSISAGSSSNI